MATLELIAVAGDQRVILEAAVEHVNFSHVETSMFLFPLFRAVMGSAIQRHHHALTLR